MAIDTRNRRASCLGFCQPPYAVWPNPDGSLAAQADRTHMAYSYPGILPTPASIVGGPFQIVAAASFMAGPVATDTFTAGPVAADTFTAGAVAAQGGAS